MRELLQIQSGQDKHGASRKRHKSKRVGKDSAEHSSSSPAFTDQRSLNLHIRKLREEMLAASKQLEFELAASIRDEVFRLEKFGLEMR